MIIQALLDFVSTTVSYWLTGLPALPAEFYSAVSGIESAADFFASVLGPLGPIVPFYEIGIIVQWWIAYLLFWLLMLALRLILWLVGR